MGGRRVVEVARRRLVSRVVLVDAVVGALIVGRLHASWFGVADTPEGESPTFFAAFVVALGALGGLAYAALSRGTWRAGPVLGRTLLAATASFPLWAAALAVVAAPFWDPIDPLIRVVSVGGPRDTPLSAIPFALVGTPFSLVVTLPLGLAFGVMHAVLVWLADLPPLGRSLQPLARARALGIGLGLVAGIAIVLERSSVATSHPWCWSGLPASLLLGWASLDAALLARAEVQARRLLRSALAGEPAALRVADGDVPLFDCEVAPLAPVRTRPLVLVESPSAGGHREASARRAVALIPRELCGLPEPEARELPVTPPRSREPR